jgi:phenylalanyl-tRNA synthetase alpha chain
MNASEIRDGLSYQERKVLLALQKVGSGAGPEQVLEAAGFSQTVEVMNPASWLQTKGLIEIKERSQKVYSLRNREIVTKGLPERRALQAIEKNGGSLPMSALAQVLEKGEVPVAIGWLRKKNLVRMEKGEQTIIVLTDQG